MAKRLFEVDKCSVCLGSHARARPSTSASSGSPELAEIPGPTAGGRYRIQAPETRSGAVKVWRFRHLLPPEPEDPVAHASSQDALRPRGRVGRPRGAAPAPRLVPLRTKA